MNPINKSNKAGKKPDKFKLECEARFWINFAKKAGRIEWNETKDRLIKRRGLPAVDRLINEMNRQR